MGSSRLPGKVLKPLGGKTVLEHVVTRVKAAKHVDDVIVATTTEPADDALAETCAAHDWQFMRGSQADVLARYARAAEITKADVVVRVTSDCPLFSPLILDQMLAVFDPDQMDYLSTNYPTRSFPVGLDCEIMCADKLCQIAKTTADPYDREHVTPFFYRNPEKFRLQGFACVAPLEDIRITLDTPEDYDRLVRLVAARPALLDPSVDVLDIVQSYDFGSR